MGIRIVELYDTNTEGHLDLMHNWSELLPSDWLIR